MIVGIKKSKITKAIGKILTPFLAENGFAAKPAKDGWTWFRMKGEAMNVLRIYHPSDDGGNKSQKKIIRVEQGVYFQLDGPSETAKSPSDVILQPDLAANCQLRELLGSGKKDRQFSFAATGENLEKVLENIRNTFAQKGLEWFEKASGRETVFGLIDEKGLDAHYTIKRYCFSLGMALSKKFNDAARAEKYSTSLNGLDELLRIEREKPIDPADDFWERFYG